jgi:flagellar motor switch protein FliN/FliY
MSGENPTPQPKDVDQADLDAALAASHVGPAGESAQQPEASPEPNSAPARASSAGVGVDLPSEPAAPIRPSVGAATGRPISPAPSAALANGVATKTLTLPDLSAAAAERTDHDIQLLSDVELNVKIELGRATMLIEDVLKLGEGSVVELDKLAGDPVDVLVNERLVARGEVLVLNDNFCVRISEIIAGEPAAT